MNIRAKDIFSGHSDSYAKYRPLYPQELYEFVLAQVPQRDAALDAGTGNGQAAGVLTQYFKEVHATDISARQIANARQFPNLHYHVCPAEEIPLPDNTLDLVTSATALHWFDFDRFFREVTRVARNNAIFASWAYSVLRTHVPQINSLIDTFYSKTIHNYWDPERRHVDEKYTHIPFPFNEISNPGFETRLTWNWQMLEGYLNTWSAVQNYIRKNGQNPVDGLMKSIRVEAGADATVQVTFPVFMRIGIVTK